MALPNYLLSVLNKLSGVHAEVIESLEEKRNTALLTKSRKAIVKLCNAILPRDNKGDRIFERFGAHGVQLEYGNIDIIFNRYIRGDCIYILKDGVTVASWADQSAAYDGLIGEGDLQLSSAISHLDLKPFIESDNPRKLIVSMGCAHISGNVTLGHIINPNKLKNARDDSLVFSAFPNLGRKRLEQDLSLCASL